MASYAVTKSTFAGEIGLVGIISPNSKHVEAQGIPLHG